jgi:hypothetical protein
MITPMCAYMHAGMIAPMCAYSWRHDSAYGAGMITPKCACMHAGMIVPMCAYSWATIAPMCAYTCRHECSNVARRHVGMKILGANKTRPNVINLKRLTLCKAHTCASMLMSHSDMYFSTREGTKFGCSWQQSGEALRQPCL